MYSLYKERCSEMGLTSVSASIYQRVFNNEYNLSFHRPVIDQCDLCVAYTNAKFNDEMKNVLSEDYNIHIENKNLVREAKNRDKAKSKVDDTLLCACFDLQEILLTPRSFESCLYYKRRLNTFTFSIYDLSNKDGYCFVWNESISNHGASEIASCVYHFIKQKVEDGKREFIFFSDNCSTQNKNRFYVTMLWFCLLKFGISSITHKYLEKVNENDSIHATIESAS